MVNFSETLKQMAKLGRIKRSYENADLEPSFVVKCLGLSGYRVFNTTSEDARRVLLDVLQDNTVISSDVCLLISPVEGVKVLNKNGEEEIKYRIHDIAYGGMDTEYPEYFMLVSNDEDTLKCHIYCSSSISETRLILTALHKAFKAARDIVANNNASIANPEDEHSQMFTKEQSPRVLKKTTAKDAAPKGRTQGTSEKQSDSHLAVPSSSSGEGSSWKFSWTKKIAGPRKSKSYETLGSDDEEGLSLL